MCSMSPNRELLGAAFCLALICPLVDGFVSIRPPVKHTSSLSDISSRFLDSDNFGLSEDDEDGDQYYGKRKSYWEKEVVDYKRMAREEVLAWEACKTENDGTAWVLLPALSVQRPTSVIHFCGGTWLGSAPHIWYGKFLQDLVKHTSSVVIATSIPITVLNTLDHVRLAKKIARQFEAAYEEIVLDEYGVLHNTTPTIAIGHSLGSRLLVVRSTLGERVGSPRLPPPYRCSVLMSFTNHAAAAGIPGLNQLYQSALSVQDRRAEPPRGSRRKRRGRDRYNDDLGALWNQVAESFQEGTKAVRSALTPSPDALEFYPAPDDLWDAVTPNKGGRYGIPHTLVVQFDDDTVDQSSKLATTLPGDVRFCRLRGTHLTPVCPMGPGEQYEEEEDGDDSQNQPIGQLLSRIALDTNAESLRNLRQSIVRYITDVATK